MNDYELNNDGTVSQRELNRITYGLKAYGKSTDLAELLNVPEEDHDKFIELLKDIVLNIYSEAILKIEITKGALDRVVNTDEDD